MSKRIKLPPAPRNAVSQGSKVKRRAVIQKETPGSCQSWEQAFNRFFQSRSMEPSKGWGTLDLSK